MTSSRTTTKPRPVSYLNIFLLIILLPSRLLAQAQISSDPKIEYWILPRTELNCILENIEKYLDSPKKLLVIFPSYCPTNDLTSKPEGTTNSSLKAGTGLRAIVWTKDELKCVATISLPQGDFVKIPKNPKCG